MGLGQGISTHAHALLAAFERDGSPGIAVNADLTDPTAVQTMADLVRAEIGPVDILVNNAGSYPRVHWQDTDEAAWNYSLDVNLTAHYRTCHTLTPGMIERRWGRIVNIGSVNARAGRTNLVAYSTAKAGLQDLTRSLARELGPYGVCVNTVMPGAPSRSRPRTPSPPSTSRARRTRSSASASLAVVGPRMSRPWWRSSWAPPRRSSLGNPSTSTAAGCFTETVNKQGDRPK
ncbi:SDR family NAD(P)-dependent oxidoreductase [Streptomyces sp. NPDC059496]|uniref:SDR family NAD(P)-dependent oxidoreductase n=1 Tax=Streptomyces sp. NPDC059496 TaxID=3346851 RepID=UPI003683FDB1